MLQNNVSKHNKKTKKTPKTSANLKYAHISKTNIANKGKTSLSGGTHWFKLPRSSAFYIAVE